jgi:hypothetical protein
MSDEKLKSYYKILFTILIAGIIIIALYLNIKMSILRNKDNIGVEEKTNVKEETKELEESYEDVILDDDIETTYSNEIY